MKSDSGRWNAENPNRVQEARARYRRKQAEEKVRRRALTPLQRAQEDLESSLVPLSDDERRALVEWATRELDDRPS